MTGHFLFHFCSPVALLFFCPHFFPRHGSRLTCPNSVLFRIESLSPDALMLPLAFHFSLPFPFIFMSLTIFSFLYDLYTEASHAFFYHLLNCSLSVSASLPTLPAHTGTDRFMWSVWFCTVRDMFRHVKELYPRKEFHLQISSALTSFQSFAKPPENCLVPVEG